MDEAAMSVCCGVAASPQGALCLCASLSSRLQTVRGPSSGALATCPMQLAPEKVTSALPLTGAFLDNSSLHLGDGAQHQAHQPTDVETGRGGVHSRFFLMNPAGFQNRLQWPPSSRLVFAHGQQEGVQGLLKLQGLVWWNSKPC